MLGKLLLVVALLLCTVGASLGVYSLIWVSSNEVHVEMQYAVDLTILSVADSNVTLNAAVINNGVPARAGLVVDFYCAAGGGPWTWIGAQVTDAEGIAQTTYTAMYNGGYDFKATVTVP